LVFVQNISAGIFNDVVQMDISKVENRPTFGIGMEIFTSDKPIKLGIDGLDCIA
jgi:hypothetical protein